MTRVVPLLALLLFVLLPPPLAAHLSIPAEFREVVHDATLIVRGRITDVRPVLDSDRGVESIGTVAVDTMIKGTGMDFVSVRVPGGKIGRYSYVMTGAPKLRAGEHAVFFLKQDAVGAWRPVGLTQGIYRVQAEPASGRPVVQPPVVPGKTAAATGRTVRGDLRRRLMPIGEFESLVRVVMATPPAARAIRRGGGR